MTNLSRVFTVLTLVAAGLLVGCAKKPPGCADPQVAEVIRQIAVDEAKKLAPRVSGGEKMLAEDVGGWVARFFSSVKVELTNVVQDGYSADARKFSCRGTLTITSASDTKLTRDVTFYSQATADDSGNFLVQVEDFPFSQPLFFEMTGYVFLKRTKGSWPGTYACEALEGSDNPLAGPFSMPVTMEVKDGVATLERTTKAGGVEKLTGKADLDSITLRGGGQNTPDDTWQTVVWGDVKGSTLQAQGEIKTPEGRLLRRCTVTLNMPTNQ